MIDRQAIAAMASALRAAGWLTAVLLVLGAGFGSPALAQGGEWSTVAVGGMDAPGNELRNIAAFQTDLKRLRGVGLESTKNFRAEAASQGVARRIPDDGQALLEICAALQIDAVIYGRLVRDGGRDAQLNLTVYSGRSGTIVGEESVIVPRGKLTRAVWRDASAAVEPHLFAALEVRPAPTPPAEPVEPEPVVSLIIEVDELVELEDDTPAEGVVFSIHGGLLLVGRSFSYTTRPSSPILTDGIQYDSSLSPGFVLDAEFYPARLATTGPITGLGVGVRFERASLVTRQRAEQEGEEPGSVETRTIKLDTAYTHFLGRVLYQHRLGEGDAPIELTGHLGFGYLAYTLEDNDQYNGNSYSYVDVGAAGYVPLGTPLFAVEGGFALMPAVSLGDSVKELGKDASAFGWRGHLGIASRPLNALSVRLGVEYASVGADVTGEGRDERLGKRSDDAFLTLRLMAGYRY